METAIAVLIILTVVLFGVLTMVQVYLSSQDAILESWREMEERRGERARTDLSPDGATVDAGGTTVTVILENEGDSKLADFDQWDVIVQYDSAGGNIVEWLSYSTEAILISGEWGNNNGEDIGDILEPGIFNPGEVMTITLVVAPPVALSTTNLATIATPNGISASAVFTR